MLRTSFMLLALLGSACGPRTHRVVMDDENNSGQSGFAILTAVGGSQTRVELDIGASNDPSQQPAHVHDGQCGEIGKRVYGLSNLTPDPKRSERFISSSTIDVGLEALLKGPYAINVHDARDFALYVSCGQLP